MTTYAKPENLIEITAQGIRQAHPDISFPPSIEPHHVADLGYLPIEVELVPELLEGETLERGPLRIDGDRILQGWVIVPAPAPTPDMVNAERDRRTDAGFEFEGVRYQSRAVDRENINGAYSQALRAIMNGAQPGDLRWRRPEVDFGWIAEDNTVVPMDAQTMLAFGDAAAAHKEWLIFRCLEIKSLSPIPHDFKDDAWWS